MYHRVIKYNARWRAHNLYIYAAHQLEQASEENNGHHSFDNTTVMN